MALSLAGFSQGSWHVEQYRFDKDHNSYYRLGRSLREKRIAESSTPTGEAKQTFDAAVGLLESDDPESQRRGLRLLTDLGPAAKSATPFLAALAQSTQDDGLRADATAALIRIHAPRPYPAEIVREVEHLSELRCTRSSVHSVDAEGRLRLEVPVAANGANFLVIGEVEP